MGRSRKNRVSARRWREEVRGGSNYLRLPEGLKSFSAKPGVYRLDFMSFVAGKGNPRAEPGEPYFERTFFVHQGIGPNQDWYLCPARTFKKPCPVCEHRAKLSADPDADEALIKSLAPKERQLWLVKDLLNDPDGLLVWEISYHLFGKQLKDKINNSDEEDGFDYFADPTDGLTMRIALQQSDIGKWSDVGDIEFRPRKTQYDSDIVEEMPCLDDMLVSIPYDKYKALLLQIDDDEKQSSRREDRDDDEKQSSRREDRDDDEKQSSRREDRDDDEREECPSRKGKSQREVSAGDVVWYRELKCEVLRVSGDGTSLLLEDSNGEIYKAIGFDDLEEPPKRTERSKPRREETKEEDKSKPKDEDDWDNWDKDEKPSRKSRSKRVDEDEEREDKPAEKSKSSSKSKPKDEDDWDNWE